MKTKFLLFYFQNNLLNDLFDFSSIEGIIATTGIGGLALIILLFIFRPIISVISGPQNREQRYRVLKLIINWTAVIVIISIFAYVVLQLFPSLIEDDDQETRSQATVTMEPIQVQKLCGIESNSIYSLADGSAQYENILDYFPIPNAKLFSYLDELKNNLNIEKGISSVNYISAPAGYGKSFVVKSHLEAVFEEFNFVSIGLTDLASSPEYAKYVFQKTDLSINNLRTNEKMKINTLPYIKNLFPWKEVFNLKQNENNIIIIDDLDEIHRKSGKEILKMIDELVFEKDDDTSLVFFVLGRPTAFFDYLSWSHLRKADFRKKFQAESPDYKTFADLNIRVDNWLDYRRADKKNMRNEIYNKLRELLLKYPELSQNFELLANSGSLIDIIIDEDLSNIHSIKKRLYDAAIIRNQGSHDRPSDNEFGYYDLIQQIARKYYDEIDSNGVFAVAENDFVISRDSTYRAKVSNLLDNSGFICFDPLDSGTRSYKFYPIWLHRLLIEESNLELVDNYEIVQCDL